MSGRSLVSLALGVLALSLAACTSDGEPPTATPSPTSTDGAAAASPTAPSEPTATQPPEEASPSIAPNGRTPDPELNALIESLLTDDAASLEERYDGVEAREHDDDTGEDRVWSAEEWATRFADGRRSLYAALTAHPQTFPHDYDVVLALNVDGQTEGWRFAVDGGEVVEVVMLDEPSTVSVTGTYERFVVLPPVEDLPQPPTGYSFEFDVPGSGDAEVDALVELVAAGDAPGLVGAVEYDGGVLPVQQCGGDREPRDDAFVERWLGALADEAYSLRAVANVPEGYVPVAEHLVVVVRETGPYDWEEAGLLEADGRIVGLQTGCVRYPPRAFIAAPPPGGVGELDPSRRAGVEVLDAVIDAFEAGNRATLFDLIDFGEIGCVTESLGIGTPPVCRAGEAEGAPIAVLPTAHCEGSYVRRDELNGVLNHPTGSDWRLYAAVDRGEAIGSNLYTRGHIAAVLVPGETNTQYGAILLNLTERGIASIWYGCGQESPEAQLARGGGDPNFAPDYLLPPPAARSALWLIEVETGRKTVLYEGGGQANARFDPDGQAVSALLHFEDDRYRSVRYGLDGRVLEQHDNRGPITTSPDGASRFYWVLDEPPRYATRFVLEHDGEPVPVEDTEGGTYGVAFSPNGSRVLISSGDLASPSKVAFTHHVVDVESGATLFTFETSAPEGTDGGENPSWSPSGRYIASRDSFEGLFVHDAQTAESVHIGDGFARWSPIEDAILALDDEGALDLVRLPGAQRTRLTDDAWKGLPRFGATGRYVYWESPTHSSTTIFDTASGEVVATRELSSTDAIYPGVHTVTAAEGGVAAALPVRGDECRGTLLIHPALDDDSRCLDGGFAARWSPDGRLLAYASGDELRVLDPASGEDHVLARGLDPADYADGALARWSPDGAYLLVQWPSGGIGWSE